MGEDEDAEADEEEEKEEEESEEVYKCTVCEKLYEMNPSTTRIFKKLGEFVCPPCLTDRYAEAHPKAKAPKKGTPPAAPAAPAPPAPPADPAPKPKGKK